MGAVFNHCLLLPLLTPFPSSDLEEREGVGGWGWVIGIVIWVADVLLPQEQRRRLQYIPQVDQEAGRRRPVYDAVVNR